MGMWDPVKGFGVTFEKLFHGTESGKVVTTDYPKEKRPKKEKAGKTPEEVESGETEETEGGGRGQGGRGRGRDR